jgi:formylglycine-generating enzyme
MKKLLLSLFIVLITTVVLFSRNGTEPNGMVLIRARNQSFMIGMDTSDLYKGEPKGGWACYVGKHQVSFTYDFYIDSTLVTQEDYLKLMGNNPSGKNTGNLKLPVEQVSWYDAILYCNARSKRDKLDTVYTYLSLTRKGNTVINIEGLAFDIKKNGYRLPTNAEYEYAERANIAGNYFFAPDGKNVNEKGNEFAWSINISGFTYEKGGIFTTPVAGKKPNPWGLYDIVGNVFEWVNDWDAPYAAVPEIDPVGQISGPEGKKIAKGGSYRTDISGHMRIGYHYKWTPESITGEIGFRCAATK